MKILVEQEGIDINAKNKVYFNYFIFQNNIWNFFKLFLTALMWASWNGHAEIVKILVGQEGIDINTRNEVYFNNLRFQNKIWSIFILFKTAFKLASEEGYTEIMKMLIERERIDINFKQYPVQYCIIY